VLHCQVVAEVEHTTLSADLTVQCECFECVIEEPMDSTSLAGAVTAMMAENSRG
jgi:hypothetical protein